MASKAIVGEDWTNLPTNLDGCGLGRGCLIAYRLGCDRLRERNDNDSRKLA